MIGNTSAGTEAALGRVLAPYLSDPSAAFVVSSDFAHWGLRFRYTYYRPSDGPALQLPAARGAKTYRQPAIHESIRAVDFECMGACERGRHADWLAKLDETGNTVCGRHPIGVVMAAVEVLRGDAGNDGVGAFKFVRYERSSLVERVNDSSVSYASAFATL